MPTVTRPLDKFVAAAQRVTGKTGKRSSGGWLRFPHPCSPANDAALSFGIREKPDGTVDISSLKPSYDHDDCLAALGLSRADFFPESDVRGSKPMKNGGVATYGYEYVDAQGNPVARVTRVQHDDGKKSFLQSAYGADGKSSNGLGGVELPLFELPKVLAAIRRGEAVYVTEGEKDALALWKRGYVATTKAGGSRSAWTAANVEALRGANLVVWGDADKPGRDALVEAWRVLRDVAASIRLVESGDAKDAYDHFERGFGIDDLIDRDDLIPKPAVLSTVCLNGTFAPVTHSYLWEPYLPMGKGVLLDADGGTGKTTFALAVAAGLSQGVIPNGGGRCEPVKTLYLMGDNDSPEELETVYRANGGREKFISYSCGAFPLTRENIDLIANTIREFGAKFVVLDPFLYFLNGVVRDVNDSVQVLPYCQMIGRMAETLGVSLLAIRHVPKSALSKDGNFSGLGTVQFRNSFRGNLHMRKHPETKGVVVITDDKGSLLNPTGDAMAFRRVGNEVQWLDEFDNPFDKGSTGAESATERITEFLRANVGVEWVPAREIEDRAESVGLAPRGGSWSRAKRKVCESQKRGGTWFLRLLDPFADDEVGAVAPHWSGVND
jgi:hypothetical protein